MVAARARAFAAAAAVAVHVAAATTLIDGSYPMFFLGSVVLLPGETIPLRVFEPRYQLLVARCLGDVERAERLAQSAFWGDADPCTFGIPRAAGVLRRLGAAANGGRVAPPPWPPSSGGDAVSEASRRRRGRGTTSRDPAAGPRKVAATPSRGFAAAPWSPSSRGDALSEAARRRRDRGTSRGAAVAPEQRRRRRPRGVMAAPRTLDESRRRRGPREKSRRRRGPQKKSSRRPGPSSRRRPRSTRDRNGGAPRRYDGLAPNAQGVLARLDRDDIDPTREGPVAYRVAATGEARFLVASRPVPELVEGDALVHANVTLLADEEEEEEDDDEVAFPLGPRGLNRGPLESCDDPNWMLGPPRRPHLLCLADDQPPRWGQIRRRLKWLFGAEAMRAVVADLGERPDARGAERKHMRPRPRRRPGERAGPPTARRRYDLASRLPFDDRDRRALLAMRTPRDRWIRIAERLGDWLDEAKRRRLADEELGRLAQQL